VSAPEGPGLGAEFRPEIFTNGDAIVETIAEVQLANLFYFNNEKS
jgi:hypothetical protein